MGGDYRDATLAVEERVRDLLGRMTLDEKVAQLGGLNHTTYSTDDRFIETRAADAMANGIGHLSRIAGQTTLAPNEVAGLANAAQRFLVERTRLGIPAILHEESCGGYQAKGATVFPQAIGLASTWDTALIERVGQVIRRQMLAEGARQTLAPVLDIARDARWGRCEETYGEDPYLASRIGVAYVRGVQGDDLRDGVACTGKHFLGYGVTEGGMNWSPTHIGPRETREVYAVPFAAAISEAHIASIMNSYSEIDGVPCGASKAVLTDLLRGELGFDGPVSSDYFTVQTLRNYHCVAATREEAAARALNAGLDVELPGLHDYAALPKALETGLTDMQTIDAAVARVLRLKFALGLFERPYVDATAAAAAFDTPADRAIALEAAQKSIVLLKNESGLLPLTKDVPSIAVIGPASASVRLLQGDYHYPTFEEILFGRIVEEGDAPPATAVGAPFAPALGANGDRVDLSQHFVPHVTVIEGVRSHVSTATEVRYARGCAIDGEDTSGFAEAIDVARNSAVAVVCVGTRSGLADGCQSGESNDRSDLGLPGVQQQLVEGVVATGTPTVVVLVNGGILATPWIAEHVPAVIEAWLPGEEAGNAIAGVLFGDVNPSGRLPVSMPRSVGQVPVFYNHKPSGGRSNWKGNYADGPSAPLYPFGHGLSYTTFEYGDLLCDSAPDMRRPINVSIDVTNTGTRSGDEIVQLYVRDLVASVSRPITQLIAFARCPLEPGKRRTVSFDVDPSAFAMLDVDLRPVIEPGEFELMAGASSADIRATARISYSGAVIASALPLSRPTAVTLS